MHLKIISLLNPTGMCSSINFYLFLVIVRKPSTEEKSTETPESRMKQ